MIEQLTPKYKFICDRCGKEKYIDDETLVFEVAFVDIRGIVKAPATVKGQVCYHCYKDFYELAGNFFNEVNKGSEDME